MKNLLILLPFLCLLLSSCDKEKVFCKGQANPNVICTTDATPVCGCDNNTYSNACVAGREGILTWSSGECP